MADSILDENELENSNINDVLTDDCLLEVFSYCSLRELIVMGKVCERWKQLCQEQWKLIRTLRFHYGDYHLLIEFNHSRFSEIHEDDLREILQCCGHFIKYLFLRHDDYNELPIVQLSLAKIYEYCTNVSKLRVDCRKIDQIRSFLEYIPQNLERLRIENEFLRQYDASKRLSDIYYDDDPYYDDEYDSDDSIAAEAENLIGKILENYKNLINFTFVAKDMKGEFLEYLPNSIEEVHIWENTCSASDVFISSIKRFHNLRQLSYKFIDDPMIEAIGEKFSLTHLSMICSTVSESSFHHLTNLVNLKKLNLMGSTELSDFNLINICNNCIHLESLIINYCEKITDVGIHSVGLLTRLRKFQMHGLPYVTDKSIEHLPNTLEILDCSDCDNVYDIGVINFLRRASHLKALNVSECPLRKNFLLIVNDIINTRNNSILNICICDRDYSLSSTMKKLLINDYNCYEMNDDSEDDWD